VARERAAADARRGSAAARGYGGKWREQALRFRARFPLCLGTLVATAQWEREAARAYHALRLAALEARAWSAFMAAGGAGAEFLKTYPIYTYHPARVVTTSAVVDHIVPHRGNPDLLWSEWNWQALDKRAHDLKTARHDGGFRGAGGPPTLNPQPAGCL
jgi:5-methylcytosine-specific restriction endonuclease McrA